MDMSQGLLQRSKITKVKLAHGVPSFVKQWIKDNTTPSSNTRNVVNYYVDGMLCPWSVATLFLCSPCTAGKPAGKHVKHWRTEKISELFERCKLEVSAKFHVGFSSAFFYKCIPKFVRLKKFQTGLCPRHYTSLELHKTFVAKRKRWHTSCRCKCAFCQVFQKVSRH